MEGHVSDEPRVFRSGLAYHGYGVLNRRMGSQSLLDFAQLDAEPTNLDLMVRAALMVEPAIGTPATQISRPVQARAGQPGVRIGSEAFSRQCRTPMIAGCNSGAADTDLARDPDRCNLAGGIQDINLGVGNRPTDTDGP